VCEIVRREKVVIPITKPYITLQGEGRNRTVITWNDTAAAVGTLMSASVVVESDHFIARDISFQVSMKVDNDLFN
jgi:pectinesterase